MKFLKIANWEKFQHYKHRNPPWIKLHIEILSSVTWVSLDDASRVLAIASMVVASKNDGCVPMDASYMQRVAYLNQPANFEPLINIGFFEKLQADASALLENASMLQAHARPETETELEKKDICSPDGFEDFWESFPRQRRGSKDKTKSAWKAALARAPKEEIMAGLAAYAKSEEVAKGFAKGAAAWLNDDRWTTNYNFAPEKKPKGVESEEHLKLRKEIMGF